MTEEEKGPYTKHKFTAAERFAVFNTYGDRCYLGGEKLTAVTFEVDHVIPETLLQDEAALGQVLKDFGLPDDFDLNDYGNWLPACRPCNGRKLKHVFRPTPIVQIELDRARSKAESARSRAHRAVKDAELGKAVATLAKYHELSAPPEGYEGVAVAVAMLADAHDDPDLPEVYRDAAKAAHRAVTLPGNVEDWASPVIEDYEAEHVDRPASEQATDAGTQARLYLTPSQWVPLRVLSDDGHIAVAEGPYGVGGGPSPARNPGPAAGCWSCGSPYWNGTRCIMCGAQNDGD